MGSHQLHRLAHSTITRVCAAWLVVLAVLPFTAPFAALDIADLLGGQPARTVVATVSASVVCHSPDDDADDVMASDACVQRHHLAPLQGLVRVSSPQEQDPVTSPLTAGPSAEATSPADVVALVLPLRL